MTVIPLSIRKSISIQLIIIQLNSIQLFIIYVPSQQPQGQLQTQHSVGIKAQFRYNNTIQYNNNNNVNAIIKLKMRKINM
jgi:hypothetical protein